jgi:hypothetical protein
MENDHPDKDYTLKASGGVSAGKPRPGFRMGYKIGSMFLGAGLLCNMSVPGEALKRSLATVHDALSKKAGDKAQSLFNQADNVAFPIIDQILFSDLSKKFTAQQAIDIKATLDEFAKRANISPQQDEDYFQPRTVNSDRSYYKYVHLQFNEQTDRLQLQWALLKRAWFWKEYLGPRPT